MTRKLTDDEWLAIPLPYRLNVLEVILERRRREDKAALVAIRALRWYQGTISTEVDDTAQGLAEVRGVADEWRADMEVGECGSCDPERGAHDGCDWHRHVANAMLCATCGATWLEHTQALREGTIKTCQRFERKKHLLCDRCGRKATTLVGGYCPPCAKGEPVGRSE